MSMIIIEHEHFRRHSLFSDGINLALTHVLTIINCNYMVTIQQLPDQ